MSRFENNEREFVQKYSALPQNQSEKELGRFQQFKEFLLPYLKRKREQAERMIEAKVKNEEAQSRKINAEALKAEMEAVKLAQEIAENAMRLEQHEIKQNPNAFKQISKEEFNAGMNELNQFINLLGLNYGTEVRIEEKPSVDLEMSDAISYTEQLDVKITNSETGEVTHVTESGDIILEQERRKITVDGETGEVNIETQKAE